MAEFYELFAEAMPLVEQPKIFARQIGCANCLVVEQGIAFRYINKELLKVEMFAVEPLLSLYLCNDTSVYVAVFQCLVYVFCLHFRNTNIQLGVLVHKLWKEARNKVRGDGGQYGNVESS